jgi:hypothetical protein
MHLYTTYRRSASKKTYFPNALVAVCSPPSRTKKSSLRPKPLTVFPPTGNVISTEAAHGLIVSSAAEKSASLPQPVHHPPPCTCCCSCLCPFSSTGPECPGAPSIARTLRWVGSQVLNQPKCHCLCSCSRFSSCHPRRGSAVAFVFRLSEGAKRQSHAQNQTRGPSAPPKTVTWTRNP